MGNKIFKGLKFPGMDDYYVLPEAVITKNEDGIIEIESMIASDANVGTDASLSTSGMAADAAAVGNALLNKASESFVLAKIAEAQLEGSDVDLSGYLTKENPAGVGSLSMNRKADSTIGTNSTTFGHNNVASGYASHAEGFKTTASGQGAHAEGQETTTSGLASHAEGLNTTASEQSAHAEGWLTTAAGQASHAEGYSTQANADSSHAEGLQTIAASRWQHVQGKYNIEDASVTYAHIVGNGDSSARSNAHTLDWEGNAWFAGAIDCEDTATTLDNLGALNLAHVPDGDTDHLIPENADLNDYITPGAYRCATSAIAKTLSNMTSYTSAGFRLIVSSTSTGNGSIQIAIFNSGAGRLWFRIRTGIDTWGDWRHIMTDGNIVDTVYPVGSIYLSVESTSPASLFGGTWTRLKDRFLLGAGSSYSNGDTGGSKTVTLTEAQIPAHTHGLKQTTVTVGSTGGVKDITVPYTSGSSSESYIKSTGSGSSHTNMPPYLVVYMWKRTE